MMAFTLRHPFPYAFLHLGKPIENRSWKPAARHRRMPLVLHGGAAPKGRALDEAQRDLEWLQRQSLAPPELNLPETIIEGLFAVARYDGAIRWKPPEERTALEHPLADSPWFFGPWGWLLPDLRAFPEPVPCPGALGLWTVTGASVTQGLNKQLAEVGYGPLTHRDTWAPIPPEAAREEVLP